MRGAGWGGVSANISDEKVGVIHVTLGCVFPLANVRVGDDDNAVTTTKA